ncbi:hypothetical protein QYE76_030832 [Lolium multiflorum]|uniref:RING-type E3 ubiquitin transferase n=1 Tax=Lolium multiflorum TaxID=4521 RepID=A0AAD8VHX9_LOLMU|nr:hypothetical protein QYE76_030832 [Lolium multiflorum]
MGAPGTPQFPGNSFVILSVSVVGILATSLLLLAYYLFLTRCGFASWRRDVHDDVVATHHHHHVVYAPEPAPRRGMEEAAIRRIPTLRYRKQQQPSCPQPLQVASECAVCLSEFQEGERLRLLPACLHAFHIDCIDAWLQGAANCPLCRAAVVSAPVCQPPHITINHIDVVAVLQADASTANADAVVIDIASPAPAGRGSRIGRGRASRMSMGDECIDPRRDAVQQQPMRRSMSMDSCHDKHLYLALQKALRQPHHSAALSEDGSKGESSAPASRQSSGRLRRSFFSFSHGHSRSSRSAILPI